MHGVLNNWIQQYAVIATSDWCHFLISVSLALLNMFLLRSQLLFHIVDYLSGLNNHRHSGSWEHLKSVSGQPGQLVEYQWRVVVIWLSADWVFHFKDGRQTVVVDRSCQLRTIVAAFQIYLIMNGCVLMRVTLVLYCSLSISNETDPSVIAVFLKCPKHLVKKIHTNHTNASRYSALIHCTLMYYFIKSLRSAEAIF